MIHNVGKQAPDQLSTKIRPKKQYKTNRKDLDGGSLGTVITGVNLRQKFAEILFPQTKKTFKRYWSGDIAKGAFNTRDGFFSRSLLDMEKGWCALQK